ncbi:hypothetical protein BDW75DRAFT_47989 [Aspergillus navahoensis]
MGKMPLVKRALIIACPFGGLLGPLADAEAMKNALSKQGFEITECCGSSATRRGILEAWQCLIDATSAGDTVVIYYTGHGALVRPKDEEGDTVSQESPTFQVLVPMDYGETTDADFRGILSIEISYLLRSTTAKSRNVTVIIDCCHSGRLFRGPGRGIIARSRNLPEIRYHSVAKFLARLHREGHFRAELDITGNPHAVRIAASTPHESAMEYVDSQGVWRGALTEALLSALELVNGHEVSWRTILLHVRRMVQSRFPSQHPQAEGPADRVPFSMQNVTSAALQHLVAVDRTPVLLAGSVIGIQEGNIYAVIPFNREDMRTNEELPEATVVSVAGFRAELKLNFWPRWENFEKHGALALLKYEVFQPLPVGLCSSLEGLQNAVQQSKYLRCGVASDSIIGTFKHEADTVTLCNHKGVQIASQQIDNAQGVSSHSFDDVIKIAERLARAQRVMNLQREPRQGKLTHCVDIEIGTVKDRKPDRIFQKDGSDYVTEGDLIYIQLENKGESTVHVSVFNINVAGRVLFMTPHEPTGYELFPDDEPQTLGHTEYYLKGIPLFWPEGVQKSPIDEQFLFVLTNSPVDVRDLADSVNFDLTAARDMPPIPAKPIKIRYDIVHVHFTVHPLADEQESPIAIAQSARAQHDEISTNSFRSLNEKEKAIRAADLPEPNAITEVDNQFGGRPLTAASRGFFGALLRANKPSCVRVVNDHDEEITVVVSKYAPNRMISGVALNASATGAGIEFTTTTFSGPATRKTLAARGAQNGSSEAVFPLWTRKEGFGVITIFKGPEMVPFVENDRVPLGATAYFRNTPDLRIVEYGSD